MNTLLQRAGVPVAALLLVLSLPSAALAQTASTTWQGYGGRGWGQSSELQQKIAALDGTAVQAIFMPILFGVSPGNLTPNFGDPRDGGSRTHEGEDMMAVKGTPIVSPTEAVVVRTGTGASEGNYVYTANPGGETFVYMHLDRIGEGVAAGTVLHPGSLIGYVGNTGNASGGAAHLHFEVQNSARVSTDPYPRLTAEFTPEQKLSFLSAIFGVATDPVALSQFLVANFRTTFITYSQTLVLPPLITGALSAAGATTPQQTVPQGGSIVPTAPGSTLVLARNLYMGLSGTDVRQLQQYLNAHGFAVAAAGAAGSSGNETTYFGPATRAAVARFQAARNIAPTAGYVGVLTRAALAAN